MTYPVENFFFQPNILFRFGVQCHDFNAEYNIAKTVTAADKFKQLLNTCRNHRTAFETLKEADPLMVIKCNNLKDKLKCLFSPEQLPVHPLSSFTNAALKLREVILVRC